MQGSDPRATGQLSPDGQWRWDGVRWVPTISSPPPLTASYVPVAAAPASRRSWLATSGGILGLVAMPFVIVGCILPYINYTDTSTGTTSSSVFNPGYPGAWPYAVEPIMVVLGSLAVAILLLVTNSHIARAVSAGALLAIGIQTVTMFFGYTAGSLTFGHIGPGGPVGLVGGILLLAGGAVAAASLVGRRPSPQ